MIERDQPDNPVSEDKLGGSDDRARQTNWLPAIVAGAVLAIAAAGTIYILRTPLAEVFSNRESLQAFLDRQGVWAPVALMALQVAQVIAAPIPGHLLAVVSGMLFGPWRGTLYTVVAVGAGSAIVLVLARALGRPIVARFVPHGALKRIDEWAARRGPPFFFLFFMLPFLPDDLACFALGLSRLPLLPMLLLIILARLPGHFVSAWIGATADRVPALGWILIVGLAVGAMVLYWRYRQQIEGHLLRRLEQVNGNRTQGRMPGSRQDTEEETRG